MTVYGSNIQQKKYVKKLLFLKLIYKYHENGLNNSQTKITTG